MTTITQPNPVGVQGPLRRRWTPQRPTPAGAVKLFIAVLLGAGLIYYVGGQQLGETALKIIVAVGISGALFVAANKLFDLAFPAWSVFCGVAGATVGFLGFLVLDGNRTLRDLPATPWLWALIGGGALGAAAFLPSAPRQIAARLPVAAATFAGVGILLGLAINERHQPDLNWGKFVLVTVVVTAVAVILRMALSRGDMTRLPRTALLGAAIGSVLGGWGCADIGGGDSGQALIASIVPLALIGVRLGVRPVPTATERRAVEQRSRSWIFLVPALLFLTGGLIVPLLRTVYLSFRDRDEAEYVGMDNYRRVFKDDEFFDLEGWGWGAFSHSWLFWIAAAFIALGLIGGTIAGRRTGQAFERTGVSMGPLMIGLFVLACSVLSTARGTLFNNIWWVVVVTGVATSVGLAVAVLADRSKGENIAKALIFLPMAISFVGAGVIWRLMYQARNANDPQAGVFNALWVGLGKLSNSGWPKALATVILLTLIAGLLFLAWTGIRDQMQTRTAFSGIIAVVLAIVLWRLLGPGLGGFTTTSQGEIRADPVLFLEDSPFNNVWLMVVLIWIQTGFAMVILSSAIKGVPQELTEAARIDGATESQVFWRVTIPQIAPTIGVVVTTLIITVMKVFDIVRVMTNGDYGTQVIANQMFEAGIFNNDSGLGTTLATLLFIAVLPVMYINIRRMQKAKG